MSAQREETTFEQTFDPQRAEVQEALGQSDAFLDFQQRLSKAAQVNRPVLIVGERGTGKELAASRIHYLSKRWDAPFIALNCAALSPTLIEAELFGHEAGAFTGATGRRRGRFEAADTGTLFLDEIGNIPMEAQEKILRAVEYKIFERVGSSQPIEVDVRIVAATNVNLRERVAKGEFMADLLDRLSFDVLLLPPLRERKDDIPLLANHFAARMAFELDWAAMPEITEEAMQMLTEFPWPGNVRELKNVIERAVYTSNDFSLTPDELVFDPFSVYAEMRSPLEALPAGAPELSAESLVMDEEPYQGPKLDLSKPFAECVRELELCLLRRALEESKFNQKRAAELLNLTYHQFRGLYRKYQDEVNK